MTKNELINILQSIQGNPEIVFEDTELGYRLAKMATKIKLHKEKNGENYIEDWEYKSSKPGTYVYNTFKKEAMEYIKIS